MYLQITTRCNFKCDHCCFSCAPGKGKHMSMDVFHEAWKFASNYDDHITIGGGEPTLHPRFFDILRTAVNNFKSVLVVTNGSLTKKMWRLRDILLDCDYENFPCPEDDYCDNDEIIWAENKLRVELSLDRFHKEIDYKIRQMWLDYSEKKLSGFGIRNTTENFFGEYSHPHEVGRARLLGIGSESPNCVCDDWIIRNDGKIKMCGCDNSPIIGDIHSGIDDMWSQIMEYDEYNDGRCWKGLRNEKKRIIREIEKTALAA